LPEAVYDLCDVLDVGDGVPVDGVGLGPDVAVEVVDSGGACDLFLRGVGGGDGDVVEACGEVGVVDFYVEVSGSDESFVFGADGQGLCGLAVKGVGECGNFLGIGYGAKKIDPRLRDADVAEVLAVAVPDINVLFGVNGLEEGGDVVIAGDGQGGGVGHAGQVSRPSYEGPVDVGDGGEDDLLVDGIVGEVGVFVDGAAAVDVGGEGIGVWVGVFGGGYGIVVVVEVVDDSEEGWDIVSVVVVAGEGTDGVNGEGVGEGGCCGPVLFVVGVGAGPEASLSADAQVVGGAGYDGGVGVDGGVGIVVGGGDDPGVEAVGVEVEDEVSVVVLLDEQALDLVGQCGVGVELGLNFEVAGDGDVLHDAWGEVGGGQWFEAAVGDDIGDVLIGEGGVVEADFVVGCCRCRGRCRCA